MSTPLISSRTAFIVGVASLADLTGRTTMDYFRSVRAASPPLDESFRILRAVKYGQVTGFVSAVAVVCTASGLFYLGYTALPVSLVVALTVTMVAVSIAVGARQP